MKSKVILKAYEVRSKRSKKYEARGARSKKGANKKQEVRRNQSGK